MMKSLLMKMKELVMVHGDVDLTFCGDDWYQNQKKMKSFHDVVCGLVCGSWIFSGSSFVFLIASFPFSISLRRSPKSEAEEGLVKDLAVGT
jgi:hypothetical protein